MKLCSSTVRQLQKADSKLKGNFPKTKENAYTGNTQISDLESYNKSFPIVKLSRKRAKDKPWITLGLKSSIQKKHILYRRFLLDQSEKNQMEYKTYNNKLRRIIKEAEISYYKKLFNEKENGIKQMWKL